MKNYLQQKNENSKLKELTGIVFTGITFTVTKSVTLSGSIPYDQERQDRMTELILSVLNNNQGTILEMVRKESDARLLEAKAIAIKEAETFIAENK